MVIEIIINNRVVKKHYLCEVNDFYLDRELAAYGDRVSSVLKETILGVLSNGKNEVRTEIDEIPYTVRILRDGYKNRLNFNGSKLPEDIETQLKEKVLRNFILYDRNLI